ncbi:hypothetical protein FA15DRAFT_372104 [Coprinopsis marcescibilis]|uniref:Uncharacterized protein n=1 Tax=Coprinopsis marcescibilis TaxID=230819 RepID=A0A5C3KXA1_COPMA|nr:hypothetical protein FA15DRAFT_372104 [Coprinopsis marcescibilis]
MVVSRKSPVAPPPTLSRSTSSQPLPRKHSKEKSPTDDNVTPVSNPSFSSSGHDPYSCLQEKSSSPALKRRRRGAKDAAARSRGAKTTLLDQLFLFSLFAFALWAAIVCPSPGGEGRATCRALSSYRSQVLEPYVVPPLKSAYAYARELPVAQPVVRGAKKVEEAVGPVLHRVAGVVVPWYHKAFLPRFKQHVQPRLERGWEYGVKAPLEPYYVVASKAAEDGLKLARVQVHQARLAYFEPLKVKMQPYVLIAQDAWTKVEPHVIRVWVTTRKTACATWKKAKPAVILGWEKAKVYAAVGYKEFVDARRRFVDPHVQKILEKVDGDGNGSASSVAPTLTSSTITPDPTDDAPAPVPTEDAEEETEASQLPIPTTATNEDTLDVAASPITAETADDVVDHIPPTASPVEAADDEEYQSVPVTESESVEPVASTSSSSSSSPSPTPSHSPEVIQEIKEEVRAVSVAQESAAAAFTAPAQATPDVYADTPVNVQEAIAEPSGPAKDVEEGVKAKLEAEDLDLDDFLSDLGVESDKVVEEAVAEPSPTAVDESADADGDLEQVDNTPTEEEVKAALAAKRKAIVDRHVEWQAKVDELTREQTVRVFVEIEGVRDWAVQELGKEFAGEKGEERSE